MKELNKKQVFINEIKKNISNNKWGLKEVEILENNHVKFHLNYDDIGGLLAYTYKHAYNLFYEDGVLSPIEHINLKKLDDLVINNYYPQNRFQRDEMKMQIRLLINTFQKNNIREEQLDFQQDLEEEQVRKNFKKIFYWTRPKLTPYS